MRITIGQLKRYIGESSVRGSIIKEAGENSKEEPKMMESDSLDSQLDRYLAEYEEQAKSTSDEAPVEANESYDWRSATKSFLLMEAPDDKSDDDDDDLEDLADELDPDDDESGDSGSKDVEKAEMPAKLTLNDIKVEEFANEIVRLIENADNLLEFRSTITRRAANYLSSTYDAQVTDEFLRVMQSQHGIVPGETKRETKDEEIRVPAAVGAGPSGGV